MLWPLAEITIIHCISYIPPIMSSQQDVQVQQRWTTTRARLGHDGDGDEAKYNDQDEEPCSPCLHNPQGEVGGCVCLMGDVPAVSFTPA